MNCWPDPTEANAGTDQSITDEITSTTLEANTPETGHGTGQWSIVSGDGGSFDNINDPNTVFTGQECTDYTLQWEITTACNQSTDNVNISFITIPSTANAGDDIYSPEQTTVVLNANNPTLGTGVWSVISGSGGSFSDSNIYNYRILCCGIVEVLFQSLRRTSGRSGLPGGLAVHNLNRSLAPPWRISIQT